MSKQADDPTVSMAELGRVFDEFASEIEAAENRLSDEVPGGPAQGIHQFISQVDDEWQSGDRTMRVHPAVNVYERVTGAPVDEDVRALLTALDAKVNAIDDIVDTRNIDWVRKIDLSVVTAFSDLLMLERLPSEHLAELAEILRNYWIELAQIPLVEQRLLGQIQSARNLHEGLAAAKSVYAYRSRDIKAFAQIPAVVIGVEEPVADRIESDLRSFRARYLLFEDFRHIKRDLREGHENPITRLVEADVEREDIRGAVRDIHEHFSYSTAAEGEYADLLRQLERRPDDLDELVTDSVQLLGR